MPRGRRLSVASFTDAWIETVTRSKTTRTDLSHLLQMRGLKPQSTQRNLEERQVASFTDAWIETIAVGVAMIGPATSHLLQMRGLKPCGSCIICRKRKSHLLQMRGLKP